MLIESSRKKKQANKWNVSELKEDLVTLNSRWRERDEALAFAPLKICVGR